MVRYCANTRLASHVFKPVVPDSIVVRDSSRVALRYASWSLQKYVTYEGEGGCTPTVCDLYGWVDGEYKSYFMYCTYDAEGMSDT